MSTAPSTAAILDSALNDFAGMRPDIEEEDARLPRYIFHPFRTKRLRPMEQGQFGITALHQGIIQPFFAFDKPEIDFDAVQRTREGDLNAAIGVDTMTLKRRNPKRVVRALLGQFGERDNIPTGTVEIAVLRGHDGKLLRELQRTLLPDVHTLATAQIEQLQSAELAGKPPIFAEVQAVLVQSTALSVTWAQSHYRRLVRIMQQMADKGGKNISKLDEDVCAWLGYEMPQLQSRLATPQMQAAPVIVAAPAPATDPLLQIQCEGCGAYSNRLANGNPPKYCGGCREPFAPEPVATASETPEFDEQTSPRLVNDRLARKQEEMRTKGK